MIREPVRLVMQELIETEATERVGAGRYERTESRLTDRRWVAAARLLATQSGDLSLRTFVREPAGQGNIPGRSGVHALKRETPRL